VSRTGESGVLWAVFEINKEIPAQGRSVSKHVTIFIALYWLTGTLLAQVGGFRARVDYATGQLPYAAAAGDFNRDGKLDLVVANSDSHAKVHHTVSVLLGNGDGTFQPQVQYGTGNGAESVAVADFNHDGKLDIVTANLFDNAANVLLGNGDGTFQASTEFQTWRHPFSCGGRLERRS
jgi:hypothetical protein